MALPVLGFYLALMHRWHAHVENAGWVVDFTYIAFACPFCRGRVEQFTYDGRPVPLPNLTGDDFPIFSLRAPVGAFETRGGWTEYRSHGVGKATFTEAGDRVSAEELAQGYYVVPTSKWPPERRPATPAHWCFASSGETLRWLDPRLIDHLTWTQPPNAPTTAHTGEP